MDRHFKIIFPLVILLLISLGPYSADGEPIRMSWEQVNGPRLDKREQQFSDFAASGLNTWLTHARIISPAITEMQYNAGTGEVTIVNWPNNSDPNKFPLQSPQDFIDFANDAAVHGLDLMFTHSLMLGDWDVLNILPSYTKTYVGGPARYSGLGEHDNPSPLDEGWWLGIQLAAAKFYAELSLQCPNVKGFTMDFETYVGTGSTFVGGGFLPRNHSSFDDQTWAAVTVEMVNRGILGSAPSVSISQRHGWMESSGVLQDYFDVQGDLIYERIALPFRQAIDAIDPNFMLGFYPYQPNGYYNGWARGLATPNAPVILMSENEYKGFNTPQSLSMIDKLDELQINYRYLPGIMIHTNAHTPEDLELDIKRSQYFIGDGYWLFDTTIMWAAPWELDGTPAQFWQAIINGNNPAIPLAPEQRYMAMNSAPSSLNALATANRFYAGPKNNLPIQVTYSPQNPDLTFHEDAQKTKLFDGGEFSDHWTAAWDPVLGQQIDTVVDLSESMQLAKIYFRGAHHLARYNTTGGTLTISTSIDGQNYTQLAQYNLIAAFKINVPFVFDNLNITARYIKIEFLPNNIPIFAAFPLSELAVWRHAISCGDWSYLAADINNDCKVDFLDIAAFVLDWLKCSEPTDINCESAL